MKKRAVFIVAAGLALLPFAYGMGATAVIRTIGHRITKKMPSGKGIALTFDDGPHPVYTVQLLDLLKKHKIQATFFVVGEKVRAYPAIVKRMHDEGHRIGIHHYEHTSSWLLTPSQLRTQIEETDHAIKEVTGESPTLYRPPWGFLNATSLHMSKPYEIVLWSHMFKDWKVAHCETGLLDGLHKVPSDGSIVLLHDDGTNPGADSTAPAHMLNKLSMYLEETTLKETEFKTVGTSV